MSFAARIQQGDDFTGESTADGSLIVGVGKNVMRGSQCLAVACSHTMAKRIASALMGHKTNRRGV